MPQDREAKDVGSGRVITYDDAVSAGGRLFHESGSLDMDELAAALNVSRATLYRVAGSRDRVLGDVLYAQGSRLMNRVVAETPGAGVDRLVAIAERLNAQLVAYQPLRRFIHDDPPAAFRVLFMPEGRVHIRFVELWRDLLVAAEQAGELVLPLDVDDLAFVFVRIGESMIYADLLAGREPNIALAATVQRALLLCR